MSIDQSDIDKLAHLSRLEFAESEHADFVSKLGSIVEFVDQLQAAETEGVLPMAHPLDLVQRLRPDAADPNIDREALQSTTDAVADGLYLVPKVIE
ncbi:MAG: Asp-tRNA(Asn)/Glu-tRNA(Gln) amidotransferase subunit GatC [Pseudomonadota bacterium]